MIGCVKYKTNLLLFKKRIKNLNYISSLENKFFKEIMSLKVRKNRYKSKLYLIEGIRFVEEAIKNNCEINYVIISESKKDYIIDRFNFKDGLFNVIVFSDELFEKVKQTEKTQGIIACLKIRDTFKKFDFNEGIYFLIDKIQDPGNLGTIIRTAVAVNALGIILIKGSVDIYNDKVLRSTMGSIFKININFIESYLELNEFIENDFKLVIADAYSDNNYYHVDLKGKIILAIGNEGNGISDEVKNFPHIKVRIPMCNDLESLNVAQALSIIAFERVRQLDI